MRRGLPNFTGQKKGTHAAAKQLSHHYNTQSGLRTFRKANAKI
jgi:hypothetical protein